MVMIGICPETVAQLLLHIKDSSNGKTLTRATASGKDITVNALNAGIGTYNYYVQYINKDE